MAETPQCPEAMQQRQRGKEEARKELAAGKRNPGFQAQRAIAELRTNQSKSLSIEAGRSEDLAPKGDCLGSSQHSCKLNE